MICLFQGLTSAKFNGNACVKSSCFVAHCKKRIISKFKQTETESETAAMDQIKFANKRTLIAGGVCHIEINRRDSWK